MHLEQTQKARQADRRDTFQLHIYISAYNISLFKTICGPTHQRVFRVLQINHIRGYLLSAVDGIPVVKKKKRKLVTYYKNLDFRIILVDMSRRCMAYFPQFCSVQTVLENVKSSKKEKRKMEICSKTSNGDLATTLTNIGHTPRTPEHFRTCLF